MYCYRLKWLLLFWTEFMARLSVELERYFLNDDGSASAIAPNEILEVVGERAFGVLFVLLAALLSLPVPMAGYAVPFATILLILAAQLIVGFEQPWLPKKISKRGIERIQVQRLLKTTIPWLQQIERIARPRLTPVCTSRLGRMVIGGAIALISIAMMIATPQTSWLPALGIFITGFGLLEDDGAIALAGLAVCIWSAAQHYPITY
jgi:hypothetical protein